jgi:hypothetical protein
VPLYCMPCLFQVRCSPITRPATLHADPALRQPEKRPSARHVPYTIKPGEVYRRGAAGSSMQGKQWWLWSWHCTCEALRYPSAAVGATSPQIHLNAFTLWVLRQHIAVMISPVSRTLTFESAVLPARIAVTVWRRGCYSTVCSHIVGSTHRHWSLHQTKRMQGTIRPSPASIAVQP